MIHFRPLPVLTIFSVAALAVLIALGVWQLDRRALKHTLIATITERLRQSAVPLEEALLSPDLSYRPVQFSARTLCAKEVRINRFRIENGQTRPGALIVTPVEVGGVGVLLLARGFVPGDVLAGAKDAGVGFACPETISGQAVLIPPQLPGWFTPPPNLDERMWFALDARAIAEANGLTLAVSHVLWLQQGAWQDRWPSPMPMDADLPDNHLSYALTWFGLGLVLIAIYGAFHMSQGRLGWRSRALLNKREQP
jgi:surfeit locus 1 family protein